MSPLSGSRKETIKEIGFKTINYYGSRKETIKIRNCILPKKKKRKKKKIGLQTKQITNKTKHQKKSPPRLAGFAGR